jgi:hypothetical protein
MFRKRRKTSTEVVKEKFTESKIVKLSYLETLALDGGLTSTKQLAPETEATETVNADGTVKRNTSQKVEDALRSIPVLGKAIPGSPFGRKTTVDTKQTVKESGWSVTKVWNQPQFDILRYAIGIKELTIAQFTYEQVSEIISIPWKSPKEIIKVSLTTSEFVPNVFPPGTYIEYYVRPNIKDFVWTRINPIGNPSVFKDDGTIVPRIINFNMERPISAKLEENFISTDEPVNEIVFRALLKRPDTVENTDTSAEGYSPILKSYRLLMVPRNGL